MQYAENTKTEVRAQIEGDVRFRLDLHYAVVSTGPNEEKVVEPELTELSSCTR